jgi:acid phosphatase type 7
MYAVALACMVLRIGEAHEFGRPSVSDAVSGMLERLRRTATHEEIRSLTASNVWSRLTVLEKDVLSSDHVRFSVDTEVKVSVVKDSRQGAEPYWLEERGFKKSSVVFTNEGVGFEVWEKQFSAGKVGLGVNSVSGGGEHYFVCVSPKQANADLRISLSYPGQLRKTRVTAGVAPYADHTAVWTNVPPSLEGQWLVQTLRGARNAAKLLNIFVVTEHPSGAHPDHLVLTFSGDPRTGQSIQWRTGPSVRSGTVLYQERSVFQREGRVSLRRVRARSDRVWTANVLNDPDIYWHTARLTGLSPGTAYVYAVGGGDGESWSELREFSTAPNGPASFSFVYMGDAQNGLDTWGRLVQKAQKDRPDAAFYLMAGDLVNRGADRDDWDSLLWNASGVFDRRPLVPAIGNHECQGGGPKLYLRFFDLPRNGPATVADERAYAFTYGDALFVILDSNLSPARQTAWMDTQLGRSRAKWKFVSFHHPAYSSVPKRDNKALREAWTPVFDKHHVDMVLQGHDHAYLRTYPMRGDRRVTTTRDGTVYVVSVSGVKFYDQDPRDYTEFGMTQVATYQVLDVQVAGDRLVYRAYDIDGRVRDELMIQKP